MPFIRKATLERLRAEFRRVENQNAELHRLRVSSPARDPDDAAHWRTMAMDLKREAAEAWAEVGRLSTRIIEMTRPTPAIPQADGAMIPDPPSVRDNDTKVAVALRDREAGPLKRALRPGEDE